MEGGGVKAGREARCNWALMNGHPFPGFPEDEHHALEITIERRGKKKKKKLTFLPQEAGIWATTTKEDGSS